MLTILILVRDRQRNLKYISKFYSHINCKKIICDSSLSKYDEISLLSDCGFDYHYFGPISYWEKIHQSTQLINTEFVIDNPDDDISIPETLIRGVDFLSKNMNYNTVDGEICYFNEKNKKARVKTFAAYAGAILEDFYSDCPLERFKHNFLKCPLAINHNIFRTKDLKYFYNYLINNKDLQSVALLDRLILSFMSINGNRKTLEQLYQLRKDGGRLIKTTKTIKEQAFGTVPATYERAVEYSRDAIIELLKSTPCGKELFSKISESDFIKIFKKRLTLNYHGKKNIKTIKTNVDKNTNVLLENFYND